MRLVLLSQGPSVAAWDGARGEGVIGINKIVLNYSCDWWCFADAHVFRDLVTQVGHPLPRVFTRKKCDASTQANGGAEVRALWDLMKPHALWFEDVPLPPMPENIPRHGQSREPRWNKFSGLAALGLAWALNADEVLCWGVDLGGDRDFTGFKNPNHYEGRWELERAVWRGLCEGFAAQGMRVRRMPDGDWR